MARTMSIISRIRRWLASRPGKLALTGGFAAASFLFVGTAAAQGTSAAQGGPGSADSAEQAAKGGPVEGGPTPHEGESKEGELEENEHEHHHDIGPPPQFNFADRDRFAKEKDAEEKTGAPPVIPYVYILVNALVLYAIYYYMGKKPVSEGLKSRRDTIAKELDEAAKVKAEAQAKLTEYSDRLDKLDHELDRMKQELIVAGEKDRDRIVKEAEEKAERMRRDAKFLLDQELKQLRIDLLKHIVETAVIAAEQVLKSRLSAQDHDRLADEYLAQLGKPGAAASSSSIAPKGGAS